MDGANVKVTYDDGSTMTFPLTSEQAWETVDLIWDHFGSKSNVVRNRVVEDGNG